VGKQHINSADGRDLRAKTPNPGAGVEDQ